MSHPVPTLGMRFETERRGAVAYSADTGPSEEMVRLVHGSRPAAVRGDLAPAARRRARMHMTASEAGEHGRRAEVGRLMLTHIWPALDTSAAVEEADRTFKDGAVELAEPGRTIEL